jgi:hypothetical protein
LWRGKFSDDGKISLVAPPHLEKRITGDWHKNKKQIEPSRSKCEVRAYVLLHNLAFSQATYPFKPLESGIGWARRKTQKPCPQKM